MDIRNRTRAEIMARINESCMAGLVPSDFRVDGEDWITFTPRQVFWEAWRLNRNYMSACGCRVYPIREYRPKRDEWRCQLTLSMLD